MKKYGRLAAVALAAGLSCGVASTHAMAAVATDSAENQYNEQLMRMSPQEQAAKLADHLGVWCIGTRPFYMGMTKTGAAKGYAYWSVTCAGGQSYMIQLPPDGRGAAIDCNTLKAQGKGRECYKSF